MRSHFKKAITCLLAIVFFAAAQMKSGADCRPLRRRCRCCHYGIHPAVQGWDSRVAWHSSGISPYKLRDGVCL